VRDYTPEVGGYGEIMASSDAELMTLVHAIIADDTATASRLLLDSPELANIHAANGATRHAAAEYYLVEIEHYLYAGDSAVHIAAAAYRPGMIRLLVAMGADVGARNRRGAQPLHYPADGAPGSRTWDPRAQADTITCLIEAGADPNAADNSGVAPLHRAVRTRCAAAVQALLAGGADARRRNNRGSTPMLLATRATGRGGSGSADSKLQQELIVDQLQRCLAAR
jgi:ankyrin repeat protein